MAKRPCETGSLLISREDVSRPIRDFDSCVIVADSELLTGYAQYMVDTFTESTVESVAELKAVWYNMAMQRDRGRLEPSINNDHKEEDIVVRAEKDAADGRDRYSHRALEKLEANGFLSRAEDGVFELSMDVINETRSKRQDRMTMYRDGVQRKISSINIAEALEGIEARMVESDGTESEVAPAIIFPKDKEDLFSHYPKRAERALIQPWDIGKKVSDWDAKIMLSSGEESTIAELFVANKLLGEQRARRNRDGTLEVWDAEDERYVPFGAYRFAESLPGALSTKRRGENLLFRNAPLEYARTALGSFFDSGVFRKGDFRVYRSREQNRPHDRSLSGSHVHFTAGAEGGDGAKYYIGRKTIVGTETLKDPESMTARQLDPYTAGIVERIHGKERILHIFDLADADEIALKRMSVEREASSRGRHLSESDIQARTVVGADDIKRTMRDYRVTDFVPRHRDESEEAYAIRVARLADPEFVTGALHDIFSSADVGVHLLPWREQLLLAGAIQEERDRDKLVELARQHGLSGVRTLLAVDYGKEMLDSIYSLIANIGQETAGKVFERYCEIIDAADVAERKIRSVVGLDEDVMGEVARVRERVMQRGKNILKRWTNISLDVREEDLLAELDSVHEGVVTFGATFKELSRNRNVELEDIEGTEIEAVAAGTLSEADKEMMRRFFVENRRGAFPDELLKRNAEVFSEQIEAPEGRFYILRHDGDIAAFLRYADREDGTVEATSLNTIPTGRGFALGAALFAATLENESKKGPVRGTVFSENKSALETYLKLGFRVVGEHGVETEAGDVHQYVDIEFRRSDGVVEEEPKGQSLKLAA